MSTRKPGTRRWLLPGVVGITAALAGAGCSREGAPTMPMLQGGDASVAHVHRSTADVPPDAAMLAAVRNATAKYHDIETALANGYQLGYNGAVTGCVANPGVGAMGYHYFNWAKMDDPSIVEGDPEVLVYHTGADGSLELGAVEWVVPRMVWEGAGHTDPPVVFGQSLHVINPVLNWYIEHAWIWTHNPGGMFADWNPNVTCP